jgi:hypothetical protein
MSGAGAGWSCSGSDQEHRKPDTIPGADPERKEATQNYIDIIPERLLQQFCCDQDTVIL